MKSRSDILEALREHKEVLQRKYFISSLALFGSYSRNEHSAASDVDVLVEFSQPIGISFIDLADEIERLLGVKTDLVSRKAIKNSYFQSIQKDLIYV